MGNFQNALLSESDLEDLKFIKSYLDQENENSFRALYEKYRAFLFRIVINRLWNDPELAGECVQESMLKAWISIKSFDQNRSFRPWLTKIAINMANDLCRKYKKLKSNISLDKPLNEYVSVNEPSTLIDIIPDQRQNIENNALSNDRYEQIVALTKELPEPEQTILNLSVFENLSTNEISQITDINLRTIQRRLQIGFKILSELCLKNNIRLIVTQCIGLHVLYKII